jgi:hypothetical protein
MMVYIEIFCSQSANFHNDFAVCHIYAAPSEILKLGFYIIQIVPSSSMDTSSSWLKFQSKLEAYNQVTIFTCKFQIDED